MPLCSGSVHDVVMLCCVTLATHQPAQSASLNYSTENPPPPQKSHSPLIPRGVPTGQCGDMQEVDDDVYIDDDDDTANKPIQVNFGF